MLCLSARITVPVIQDVHAKNVFRAISLNIMKHHVDIRAKLRLRRIVAPFCINLNQAVRTDPFDTMIPFAKMSRRIFGASLTAAIPSHYERDISYRDLHSQQVKGSPAAVQGYSDVVCHQTPQQFISHLVRRAPATKELR